MWADRGSLRALSLRELPGARRAAAAPRPAAASPGDGRDDGPRGRGHRDLEPADSDSGFPGPGHWQGAAPGVKFKFTPALSRRP